MNLEATFEQLIEALIEELQADEHFTLGLLGEQSQFVRFNGAKVRQGGVISDCEVSLTLMTRQRTACCTFPLTGDWQTDWAIAHTSLIELRDEVPQLPEDPYLVLPAGNSTSREVHEGQLLPPGAVVEAVLPEVSNLDFTGIYTAGNLLRAYADSVGQKHWFATETFCLDYSIFLPDGQAVKDTFAGSQWDQVVYSAKLTHSKQQLEQLAYPPKPIPKGQYRTYLAPAAIAEIINALSWGSLSEAALQQGESALAQLQRGEKAFSPTFNLIENFRHGLVPRFNNLGEIAPTDLPLITQGKLVNTLISSRTAKEYGKQSNGANGSEMMRAPELLPGTLAAEDILKTLDTGLYLSNLHYLNWSDRPTARLTGMTRYACFWVENGEIVAPIENLRFDESLYRCFGDNLVDFTRFQEFIPEVGTYDHRNLGAALVPGALVDDFTYTL